MYETLHSISESQAEILLLFLNLRPTALESLCTLRLMSNTQLPILGRRRRRSKGGSCIQGDDPTAWLLRLID